MGQGMRIRNQATPAPTAWEPYMWQQHLVRKLLLFGSLGDAARQEDQMNVYVGCIPELISRALKLTSRFTPCAFEKGFLTCQRESGTEGP